MAAREQEQRLDLAKLALEQEKPKVSDSALQCKQKACFDVYICFKLMPKFNCDNVVSFSLKLYRKFPKS